MPFSRPLLAAAEVLLITGALLAPTAHAAPATSEELNASNDEISTVQPLTQDLSTMPSPINGTGVRQSTTVELLLQLQDRTNVKEAEPTKSSTTTSNRSSRDAGKQAAEPAPEEALPLSNLKTMLLGREASRADDTDARVGPASGYRSTETAGPAAMPSSRYTGNESREGLLSHPVVRFIRENRVLTISASIAVLVGLWLTANYPTRRRR